MAFNPQEQEIIRAGVQAGKSKKEVIDALTRYRTGQGPIQEPKKEEASGFMAAVRDIPSDIAEGAKSAIQTIDKTLIGGVVDAGKQALSGEISPAAAAAKAVGSVGKTVASLEGEGLMTLAKLFASPETERKTGELVQTTIGPIAKDVIESEPVKALIKSYESAPPEAQAWIDGVLGTAEGLTSTLGLGVAKKVGTEVVDAGLQAGKKAVGAVSEAAKKTASALGDITSLGEAGIKEAAQKTLDPSAIMQRVARISKGKQAAFEKTAGESVGEYLVKRGIFGDVDDITTQLYSRFQQSKNTADEALASLEGLYKPKSVQTALDELFAREARVSTPGALSKDFARVRELKNKIKKEGLDMSEINEAKRIYERNVRVDYLKENKPEAVARATNLDSSIREWQLGQAKKLGLSNLEEINRETRLAKNLLDDLGKEYAGSAGNNALSLTDWIVISNIDPTAIGGLIAKKTLSSKKLQSKLAKALAGSPEKADVAAIFSEKGEAINSYLDWVESLDKRSPKR